ncbi:hypothetical protein EIP86_001364 [Pleurotus ostreatoroseus]|nr:hypothetical protein EIP86_001364 [Pleurotus ostreatoroseus]
MESKKRKRDQDSPTVVTFHAPTKSFARVFKGTTLKSTRKLVRKKLGLASGTDLTLVHLREGARVDLEDDDDFEAFCALTHSHATLDILVKVEGEEAAGLGIHAPPEEAAVPSVISVSAPGTSKKKRKKSRHHEDASSREPSTPADKRSDNDDEPRRTSLPVEADSEAVVSSTQGRSRERRKHKAKAESTENVAGPSRVTIEAVNRDQQASSAKKKKTKSLDATADAVEKVADAPKKRKKRDQADPYVNAEHTTIALDLDSVPPEEPLPATRQGKKRKLDADRSVFETSQSSEASPQQEGARPKKRSKKRREEPSDDIPAPSDETVPVPLVEESHKTKKHRRRADEETSPAFVSEALIPPAETNSDETLESAPAGFKKKKRGANGDTRPEMVAPATDESVDKNRKSQRKAKQQTSQDARTIATDAPKEKRKIKKAVDTTADDLETEAVAQDTADAPVEATPAKGKTKEGKGKPLMAQEVIGPTDNQLAPRSNKKALLATSESSEAPATPVPDVITPPKKRLQKKHTSTTSPSSGTRPPDVAQAAPTSEQPVVSTPQATEQVVVPEKSKKSGRKKQQKIDDASPPMDAAASESTPASKSRRKKKAEDPKPTTEPGHVEVDISGAVNAVLARHSSGLPPTTQADAPGGLSEHIQKDLGTELPVVRKIKPKASKSRLSQSWGPADLGLLEAETPNSSIAITASHPAVKAHNVKALVSIESARCIVCGNAPWHSRPRCPVITAGAESIEKWFSKVKSIRGTDSGLLKEMRALLKEAKAKQAAEQAEKVSQVEVPEVNAEVAVEVVAEELPDPPSPPEHTTSSPMPQDLSQHERELSPEIPFPSSPARPAASEIDEVAVEGRDEGSSSESEEDEDADGFDQPVHISQDLEAEIPFPSFATQPEVNDEAAQALLRGPTRKRSLLAILADDSDTEEDSEPEEVRLAGDEEDDDRAFRRLSRRFERDQPSSDEDVPADVGFDGDLEDADVAVTPQPTAQGTQPDDSVARERSPEEDDADEAVNAADEFIRAEAEDDTEELVDGHIDQVQIQTSPQIASQPEEANPASATSSPSIPLQPLATELEELPSASTALAETEVVPDSEDRIASPPPNPLSRASSQEDPTDPIEPADDLLPKPKLQEAEPIEEEPDLFEPTAEDERVTPPATIRSQPGTAKRMKDRNGKVPASNDYAADVAAQLMKSFQTPHIEPLVEEQDAVNGKKPAAKARVARTQRKSAAGPADHNMPPPPVPDAAAPKRRGRPPISEEEKARRAAEKQAEKDRKAAERKAQQEMKAAEKARSKLTQTKGKKGAKAKVPAAETSAEVGTEQQDSASSGSASAVEGILAATPATGASTPAVENLSANATARPLQTERVLHGATSAISTPSNVAVRKPPPMSEAKWATLPETPQTQESTFEAEESMYDELRSSSPGESESVAKGVLKPVSSQSGTNGLSQPKTMVEGPTTNGHVDTNGVEHEDVDADDPRSSPPQEDDMPTPTPKSRTKKDPLFVLSQAPLSSPVRPDVDRNDAALPHPNLNSQGSNLDSNDADRFSRPMKPATYWSKNASYRRLSDIASQTLFPPSLNNTPQRPAQSAAQAAEERRKSVYSQLGGDDDDSSSSSSDSDADKSHIPKARRAGVKARMSNAV